MTKLLTFHINEIIWIYLNLHSHVIHFTILMANTSSGNGLEPIKHEAVTFTSGWLRWLNRNNSKNLSHLIYR